MKFLLIGPYPPPHGGISVHVAEAKKYLEHAGAEVCILNSDRRAAPSEHYLRFRSVPGLALLLFRHARAGWVLHLHTNGHNPKSWAIAFLCGLAGQFGPGCLLTLHSGMTPAYLSQGSALRRILAWLVCRLYDRVIAVNLHIQSALTGLGIPKERVEMLPAYLAISSPAPMPATLEALIQHRWPVLTSVLFYRPEYGFELLAQALARLRKYYPNLLCLVMGSGEQQGKAQQRLREQSIEDAVVLLGDVPHEVCLSLISGSDVFVRATLVDGDAISVREALSLGVPAVASDVCHRPPDALGFRSGDPEDLISKVEIALREPCRNPARREAQTMAGGFPRLSEIYRQSSLEGAQG